MNDLFSAALAARTHAHAPYSGFAVGAALRTPSGRIFAGANVENAAYPQGQCAEASAIGAMVAAGEPEIVEVAVVGGGEGLCTPCGGCRQRLAEFAGPEVQIHVCGPEGLRRTLNLGELLPFSFSGRNLGVAGTGASVDPLDEALAVLSPKVAIVLGSGLDALAERIEVAASLHYTDLRDFPRPTVAGHSGTAILGRLAGVPVLGLRGRAHLYEGNSPALVARWIRRLRGLGVTTLVLTNAAGSLRPQVGPGSLVVVSDHINMQGASPLVGPNDDGVGPRFPDLSAVYDPEMRAILARAGDGIGIALATGVYLACLGPAFETPAEIRAFRALGADLVGMSTVPEAIAAVHAGMKVAAISVVTNLAAGLASGPLSHEETLAGGRAASARLADLLEAALPEIARAA